MPRPHAPTSMNVASRISIVTVAVMTIATGSGAQQPTVAGTQQPTVAKLVATPATLTLQTGQSVPLTVTAYDSSGAVIPDANVRVSAPRRSARYAEGKLTAIAVGRFNVTASSVPVPPNAAVTLEIPVTITWAALKRIQIIAEQPQLHTGVTVVHRARGFHEDSTERLAMTPTWRSSNPAVAKVDRFGNVTGVAPGAVTITAETEGVRAAKQYTVTTNPVASIELGLGDSQIRTGDVIHLKATARRANGTPVNDAALTWSYTYTPDDSIAPNGFPGGGGIVQFGRFVANYPGRYTILAHYGPASARTTIQVAPRDVRRRITVMGRGNITDTHTSDLWPWTGKDGRDYALVGTWGGNGYAMVFDITDPTNIVKTDSVQVNARTINDVTVSPDGRYGVLSREGASDRVNGVVFLDLANPAHPKIAATFSQELTGGVHNMFATNDYFFAVSGGAKYVIVDVKDIYNPKYVSEYRHPNARLHDLWVHDGIAYSAQGGVGTVVVDVGNGKYGGTIEKPKLVTVYRVNSGHEIYPYFQKSTGKVYLFIGDEEMSRTGRTWEGTSYNTELRAPGGPVKGGIAQTSGGYTHIIDFTDPLNPIPVGRYHIEDYGSHDIIVQDDVLYQAYYDGGIRVVDVSGELMGNIYDQGREIAVFKPYDPQGFTANAPFVMNAMPWKGNVLFTDFNSGLWAAKLEPRRIVP